MQASVKVIEPLGGADTRIQTHLQALLHRPPGDSRKDWGQLRRIRNSEIASLSVQAWGKGAAATTGKDEADAQPRFFNSISLREQKPSGAEGKMANSDDLRAQVKPQCKGRQSPTGREKKSPQSQGAQEYIMGPDYHRPYEAGEGTTSLRRPQPLESQSQNLPKTEAQSEQRMSLTNSEEQVNSSLLLRESQQYKGRPSLRHRCKAKTYSWGWDT